MLLLNLLLLLNVCCFVHRELRAVSGSALNLSAWPDVPACVKKGEEVRRPVALDAAVCSCCSHCRHTPVDVYSSARTTVTTIVVKCMCSACHGHNTCRQWTVTAGFQLG
jgi:hypothetical protein